MKNQVKFGIAVSCEAMVIGDAKRLTLVAVNYLHRCSPNYTWLKVHFDSDLGCILFTARGPQPVDGQL